MLTLRSSEEICKEKKVHKKQNAGLIYWNLKLMDFLDHTHFSPNDA